MDKEIRYKLDQGYVITLDIGGQLFNIVKAKLGEEEVLAVQGYGNYPTKILDSLLSRNNLEYSVADKPPQTPYCEITDSIFEMWGGGKYE